MVRGGTVRAVAELVRLPAVLSVPGDVLLGEAAGGRRTSPGRLAALCLSSSCLYLGGMALNDWADREVDARERPHRPIPSGRVSAGTALGVAAGLTAAGLVAAAAGGGARGLGVAVPVAAAAWGYDLVGKSTAVAPLSMATARALDVLLGASGGSLARALPAAGIVGAHTAVVTGLSRHEVEGGDATPGRNALLGTAAVTAAAAALAARRAGASASTSLLREDGEGWAVALGTGRAEPRRLVPALGLLAAYAATVGAAQDRARRTADAPTIQRAVGAGVLGLIPLEAGLMAAQGRVRTAAAVAGLWPLARTLARRRSVT